MKKTYGLYRREQGSGKVIGITQGMDLEDAVRVLALLIQECPFEEIWMEYV
jgi:uncharacterized membrane protein (Fun14 family)